MLCQGGKWTRTEKNRDLDLEGVVFLRSVADQARVIREELASGPADGERRTSAVSAGFAWCLHPGRPNA